MSDLFYLFDTLLRFSFISFNVSFIATWHWFISAIDQQIFACFSRTSVVRIQGHGGGPAWGAEDTGALCSWGPNTGTWLFVWEKWKKKKVLFCEILHLKELS